MLWGDFSCKHHCNHGCCWSSFFCFRGLAPITTPAACNCSRWLYFGHEKPWLVSRWLCSSFHWRSAGRTSLFAPDWCTFKAYDRYTGWWWVESCTQLNTYLLWLFYAASFLLSGVSPGDVSSIYLPIWGPRKGCLNELFPTCGRAGWADCTEQTKTHLHSQGPVPQLPQHWNVDWIMQSLWTRRSLDPVRTW